MLGGNNGFSTRRGWRGLGGKVDVEQLEFSCGDSIPLLWPPSEGKICFLLKAACIITPPRATSGAKLSAMWHRLGGRRVLDWSNQLRLALADPSYSSCCVWKGSHPPPHVCEIIFDQYSNTINRMSAPSVAETSSYMTVTYTPPFHPSTKMQLWWNVSPAYKYLSTLEKELNLIDRWNILCSILHFKFMA